MACKKWTAVGAQKPCLKQGAPHRHAASFPEWFHTITEIPIYLHAGSGYHSFPGNHCAVAHCRLFTECHWRT
jgi:hypothetical protein